jgi:hypothetical protein
MFVEEAPSSSYGQKKTQEKCEWFINVSCIYVLLFCFIVFLGVITNTILRISIRTRLQASLKFRCVLFVRGYVYIYVFTLNCYYYYYYYYYYLVSCCNW